MRTQVLGANRAQALARQFGLTGRVDLYFAFIEGIGEVLRPGGVAGIIVSNRFMTTRSGCTVRERLLERFDVLHVWDFGDTKLFAAAVLPAVLLLRKKDGRPAAATKFSSIYSTAQPAQHRSATIFDALLENGVVAVNGDRYLVRHGELDHGKRAVDLAKFPRAACYLERHRKILEARRYVIEGGRQWFKIWVPHNARRSAALAVRGFSAYRVGLRCQVL